MMLRSGSLDNRRFWYQIVNRNNATRSVTYPISGVKDAGIFLAVVVCCSSSNTLNKLSPKASAMIVRGTFPTIQHEVLPGNTSGYGSRVVQNVPCLT